MTVDDSATSRWIGDSDLGDRFPAWTRGNAADVFPDPFSPLGKDLVLRQAMSRGLRDGYISIGVLDFDEFEEPESPDLFKMFGGYVYNPLTLTRILGARMPGVTPELIDQAFFDDRDEVPPYEAQPWHVSPTHEARLGKSMALAMSVTELPELDADRDMARAQRAQRPDLTALTDAALIARARSMVPLIQRTFENAMRISSLASLGSGALGAISDALGDPTMAIRLLAGIEVDSGAPSHAMWELGRLAAASPEVSAAFDAGIDGVRDTLGESDSADATAFLARFDQFLVDHGARGQNEYDPIAPSWELRPRAALAAIDLMRRSDESLAPAVRSAAAVAERDRVAADVRARLADDPETAATFEAALGSATLFLGGRERAKTNVVIVINELRVALHQLGRRLVERGILLESAQVFMSTDAELDHLRHDPAALRTTLLDRWAQYRRLFEREPVFVVNGRVPSLDEMTQRGAKAVEGVQVDTVLTGAAGSGGVATGRARVVLDASDPGALEPGDVLIAPQTDPSWVPLFVPAAAVVVDVGAMGSHAMIVSRELGIPCVASVADATARIPDGAVVRVDGNAGTVTVVELP
jgi:rifampicin phosphotransferase